MHLLKNKRFKTFFIMYLVFNVLVTYMTTTSTLNKYIVTFSRTPLTEISSIIGNVSFLLIFLVLGLFIFKKEKSICKYMLCITFLCNLLIFLLGYFTKNYKTMLSIHNFTIFRNPAAGFASQVVIDGLRELIFNFRIFCFSPFVIMLIYYFVIKGSFQKKYYHFSLIRKFIVLLSALLLSVSTVLFFKAQLKKNWEYRTEVPQYGCQVCGIYNYYFAELLYGLNYSRNYVSDDIEVIKGKLDKYDKNKESYVNVIDEKVYKKSNNPILKDYNVFIIQAESLQTFVLEMMYKENNENKYVMPYMQKLLEDDNAFCFKNAYTVVGLGNTSDAEFAVNSGLFPVGDLTIAWEANDKAFTIQNIASTLSDNYVKKSYNPTVEKFYAHRFVHENFYSFNRFYGIESYRKDYPQKQYPDNYLKENWVSDEAILNYALGHAIETVSNNQNFYTFLETISPHYPFDDLSDNYSNDKEYIKLPLDKRLSDQFKNYINQFHHNDKIIYDFIMKAQESLPNTLFIIYGDHGNTLEKQYYEVVLGRNLSDLEYRRMLLNIPIIFYDPSGLLSSYVSSLDLNYMLNRTVNQVDIYRTIYDLLGFENDSYLFGVNLFSLEPSFSIDPKNLDIITDDFIYSLKNEKYEMYIEDYDKDKMQRIVSELAEFKLYNDYYISYTIAKAKYREGNKSPFDGILW